MSQNVENPQTPANGLYVGEIRLLPFRHDELPFGWHFCNGERFLLTSPQGEVLSGLSENFRADWGLEEDLCSISLPNLFHEDGRGCFLRPVNGLTRQVGALEGDAIRNITGEYNEYQTVGSVAGYGFTNGVFTTGRDYERVMGGSSAGAAHSLMFDASRVVPTAPENRPLNLGMTPAIYLGV
ncbi:hypothetical protein HMPREF1022_00970 [Desulfovibrio sp. 6_1_46AFAA]|uniref:hypothetical protein n=1 Tax=Desulfovibrio sp. 6_1_46AFAA TaxID=665942 RepID=UPI00022372A1|nr:hypothetical protein [Desulfovibrio sp. 6_1_46AFAA]EGW52002.1 hypothetical protein HMPREF1022_00970 [Desulfovibrio sp. 6_1_46AFAA]